MSAAVPETLYIALLEIGSAYRAGMPPEQQPGFAGHAAHMRSLTAAGTLILGGPFGPVPRRLSGPMLLLRAGSLGEARRIVGADPGISNGLLRIRAVDRWYPASGVLSPLLQAPLEGR